MNRIMKKSLFIALAASLVLTTGCQNWLDVNDNPNYVSDADVSLLMPSAELAVAHEMGFNVSLYGHFWAQYVNQNKNTNQYYTNMTYDVTNSSFTRPWQYFYSFALPTLKEVIDKSQDESHKNYLLQARTMTAYTYYVLTSLFEDVAYTEGFLKETTTPHFDKGREFQKSLVSMLEVIRSMDTDSIESSELVNNSAKGDMIFGGDNEAWMQFANTIYLKVLMREFDKNSETIKELLAEDNFLEIDAAFDNFEDKADKSNPFYENDRRQLNTQLNIRACTDILNVLDADDPRLEYYYEGGCEGTEYGVTPDPNESSRLQLGATDPVYFSTVDEVEFLKAEAYARLNDAGAAQEAYENALKAAFVRTVGGGAEDFIGEGGAYEFVEGTPEQMIEQIINQKWASNVRAMAIESWFDMNRTGYPERGKTITDYSGVLEPGHYPYRFIYAKNSADYNPNSPEPVAVDVKMWWHK